MSGFWPHSNPNPPFIAGYALIAGEIAVLLLYKSFFHLCAPFFLNYHPCVFIYLFFNYFIHQGGTCSLHP